MLIGVMRRLKLVIRSLVFYRRTHLGVLLGSLISTGILVGALVVGDSVRHSLQQITFARLGKAEHALTGGDRFFRSALADELTARLDTGVAPLLVLRGIVVAEDGRRANQVQVLGVDDRFRELGRTTEPLFTGADQALVNQRLAARLGVTAGDEILVRIEKADQIPGDVPLTSRESTSVAFRVEINEVAGDDRLGRFGLRANQVSPLTIFLPLDMVAARMELRGRANLLLVAESPAQSITTGELGQTLADIWQLADAGLRLRNLPDGRGLELISDRVFIDPPVEDVALAAAATAQPVLTYFVNLIGGSGGATPYSFVSAPGPPLIPDDMSDNEIILNSWLADDIEAKVGDKVKFSFYIPAPGYRLREKMAALQVRSIVKIAGAAADGSLMPLFPGLSDADSCREWDPGIPIDLDQIRDKDEAYWNQYRGVPKAFVTLSTARKLWSNRFGALTAVRYPEIGLTADELAAKVLQDLDPAALGLTFVPVRQEGIRAGGGGTDFGGLFIGLSFFIIAAALLLTGLLFVLGVEQRAKETGILRSLGFTPQQVRRLLLGEGVVLAVIGALLGTAAGIAYNKLVLHGLGTVWQGAVGATTLQPHIKPLTLAIGLAAGIIMAVLAMLLAAWRHARKPLPDLLGMVTDLGSRYLEVRPRLSYLLVSACLAGVLLILILVSPGRGREAAGAFGGAGTLMLIGTITICYILFLRLTTGHGTSRVGVVTLGVRNAARKRRRSLITIVLLATGVFIIVAVAANRQSSLANAEARSSGTGGFAFFGQTTIPLQHDLNEKESRRHFGLEVESSDVSFVQMRMREGDDASCLNLNRTAHPTILGVKPKELSDRGAFTFVRLAPEVNPEEPWLALDEELEDGVIPAVADQAVLTWGLGKSVGDELSYTDEHGRQLRLKLVGGLANSVFQGKVIVSEKAFLSHFPSNSGARVLLVDAIPEHREMVTTTLTRSMQDYGLDLTPAAERLAEFTRVENTYLTIFLALGGLGLILGTVGMGVIVLRDILEQRGELALLRAVGFSRGLVQRMLLSEYTVTLIAGVVCGAVSGIVAVLPSLLTPGTQVPYTFLLLTMVAIAASGVVWIFVATRAATRGELIPALRNE
jgi:putative ABC transport system permease protein